MIFLFIYKKLVNISKTIAIRRVILNAKILEILAHLKFHRRFMKIFKIKFLWGTRRKKIYE